MKKNKLIKDILILLALLVLMIASVTGVINPDTNGDGCVDLNEIITYIDLWKQGQVTLQEVINAIDWWKQGCGTTTTTIGTPTNNPPTVSLTSPQNGATYTAPATINMAATASDSDGTITKVEFLNGNTVLYSDTSAPYSYTWNNVGAGIYTLKARAYDNEGATTDSSPITINVESEGDPTISSITLASVLGPLSAGGDADDPAIWIHPTNVGKSLMFVSDKRTGIYVYNFNGQLLQHIPIGSGTNKLNNLDSRTGLICGSHQVDILAGNLRHAGKLAVLKINPNYGGGVNPLTVLADQNSAGNNIRPNSYLFTLYKRLSDGTVYVFDKNSGSGPIVESRIDCSESEQITVTPVRTINDVNMGTSEGAVADDELGYVYFAEERSRIHKYNADPSSSNLDRLSFFATGDGISGDREGLALYGCNDDTGYLILSSQGNSQFKVYDRQQNALLKTFDTQEASGTDGLDVSPFSVPGFPDGFLLIHDGGNNYYVYDWNDLAEDGLIKCVDGGSG